MIRVTGVPTLETERLTLRPIAEGDASTFVRYFGSDRARHTGGPMSEKAAWRHFAMNVGHWSLRGFGMFTLIRKGEHAPIGLFGHYYPLGWAEREVGWILFNAEDEGQGLAKEAAKACIAHAFDTLGWDTAVSYIAPGNAASIRLAERLGANRDTDAAIPDGATDTLVYRHARPS